ncbi:hypothetical protein GOP47_0023460 [Adiantum capillus-veneris]|uniref:C2 NT-type domain-containing protein n=1 Tax=Adiantum capillus-veneris TaxID=13818 RepID=A0A9D4Z4J4_ADICA|nr:hypothetical protein GOP47_0023460 [Adiantum capillus-veneris]
MQVPQQRWDKLLVSIVSLETGKTTSKTGKSPVKNGTCRWGEALFESILIAQELNKKDVPKESYKLVVSTGLSRFGILGDATINFVDYLQSTTPVSLLLPLQNCNFGSILHVKIQRMVPKSPSRDTDDQKESLQQSSLAVSAEGEQCTEVNSRTSVDDASLGEENSPQADISESVEFPSTPLMEEPQLQGRDDDEFMSLTSSASSSGRLEVLSGVYDGEFMSPERLYKPLGPSSSSYISPPHQNSSNVEGTSPIASSAKLGHEEKTRWETSQRRTRLQRTVSVAMPSSWDHDANQLAVAEIEALRQQLANEAKRSEEVHKKLSMLIEERDIIKEEMESLKLVEASPPPTNRDGVSKWQQEMDGEANRQTVKELQDELDYVKGINLNLSVQLEKTQESNSELLLEIQDLEKELDKQRSERTHESTRMEDSDSDSNKLVESLRKELAVLERDSQELTEENLDLLSQLKQANDKLNSKDDTIDRLVGEKVHFNDSNAVIVREGDTVDGDLREKLRENEEARLAIEAESQSFLDRAMKAENDHLNTLEIIKNLKTACQMLEQEKGETIHTLRKQLEETNEQLSAISRLYDEEMQVTDSMKVEKARLEVEIAAILKAKEEERNGLCQLQAINVEFEEKLFQEQLNASKLMHQYEAVEANSLRYQTELDASQAQVKNMQQIITELETSQRDLKNELYGLLEKDKFNRSQIKDLELRVAMLEDETNSLRSSRALLEAELQDIKLPKDVMNWSKQSKIGVEENLSHFQDTSVKGSRRPLEEKNTEANEHLQKQSSDLSWKLSEKEVELQDLKTRVFFLEEELQRKVNALASAERRLKEQRDSVTHDGGNQVSYLTRSLSRANSRVGANKPTIPPSREAKELSDLRSKVKLLEAEVKTKAAELEASKEHLKEQYTQLSSRIEHLELVNEELVKEHSNSKLEQALKELSSVQNQNAMLCQRENEFLCKLASQQALQCEMETLKEEKKELESALSRFNAAAKGENILKRISTLETELAEVLESNLMYKTQLQSVFAKQQNVHAAALENLGSVDKVVKDLAELKRKNMILEDELCDMKERYFNMSLQFAEVEAEREELVMTIRNLRGTKKFAPLRSAIF